MFLFHKGQNIYKTNTCLWHRDNLKITIFVQREIPIEYYK